MALIKFTKKQLNHLVSEGVAKSGNFKDYEDLKFNILEGGDTSYTKIGYSENECGCTGCLYKAFPSNKLYVVTGQAIFVW